MLVESVRRLWNDWEIQVMVLISLSFQIILIMLGNRRKYSTSNWVRIVVWLTYMGADWIATVALGILCDRQGDIQSNNNADNIIMALWAPFLLIHLGGPDTITAYVVEDNELWLRHLLGLLVQVGLAIYVFVWSLTTGTDHLIFLAIPLFVAGIFKYGERTWVFRSASSKHFRDSLLPPPNPGPDYEGQVIEESYSKSPHNNGMNEVDRPNILQDYARFFHEANEFFMIFRRLFHVDLIFNLDEIKSSSEIFSQKTSDEAFKCIEQELGYMFDYLYTKASLVYSRAGSFLRPISFISTLSAFVGFLIVDKQGYSSVNIIITYILLVGAIVLEIYAVIILLSSDWAMLWLRKPKSTLENKINQAIFSLHSAMNEKKRRSYSMSQHNLISLCLRRSQRRSKPTMCYEIQNEIGIYEMLEKYQQIGRKNASNELKECIFKNILRKVYSSNGSFERGIELCSMRGDEVIRNFGGRAYDKLIWSIEVEFDESILLWHIATELCFHMASQQEIKAKETSKLLSDYMLYLLVMHPFMLPKGIWQIRFQDTAEAAVKFFQRNKEIKTSVSQACEKLLEVDCEMPESKIKGDASKSVLFDGCRLAKSLQALLKEEEEGLKIEDTWEMISNVWVEMLCYAANQCRWNQHAQQLRRGGELLTHVSLLMTHLGLTEQLKIFVAQEAPHPY